MYMNKRIFFWINALIIYLPLAAYAQAQGVVKSAPRVLRPGAYEQLRPGVKTSVPSPGVLKNLRPTVGKTISIGPQNVYDGVNNGGITGWQQTQEFSCPLDQLQQKIEKVARPPLSSFDAVPRRSVLESLGGTPFFTYSSPRPFYSEKYPPVPAGRLLLGKHEIEAVIFDMDGTLLDSLPAWEHACAKFLRTHGVILPPEIEKEIEKMSLEQGAKYIKEQLNLPMSEQELLKGTLGMVHQHYATDILPKRGALETLVRLRKQGIKVGVATSSNKDLAEKAFERLGMSPYVDFVISCDEVGVGKTSPDVYEAARERLGSAREHTLVVEDALYAVRTAKEAGVVTAGVEDTFHPPSYEAKVEIESDYFFVSLEDMFKK